MQPVCKKVVVHDKIEEIGLKSKLTLRQGGGGGKNLSINLTLSVQWVGMDGFPYSKSSVGKILFPHASLSYTAMMADIKLVPPLYFFLWEVQLHKK